jgi:cell division protein FtsB
MKNPPNVLILVVIIVVLYFWFHKPTPHYSSDKEQQYYNTIDSLNKEIAKDKQKIASLDSVKNILAAQIAKDKKDLQLTTDEKQSFQETMDEFVTDVSDLSDFGVLNVYENSAQWSGKILDADIEFFYSIGEENGVYINGDMIKLDQTLVELIGKLTSFEEKFKSKWAKVISLRKKTKQIEEE